MKKFPYLFIVFIISVFPNLGVAQDISDDDFTYGVNTVYPPLSVTKKDAMEAQSLVDLHPQFPTSWIRTYKSVEILTSHNGKLKKAMSNNEILTQEQKDNLNTVDVGTEVSIKVRYIPENNLKNKQIRNFDFAFIVAPELEAQYTSGEQQLQQYLKENIIDKIPDGTIEGYALAAVKFTVSEEGEIMNPQIFQTSNDENVDELMLETIRKMPCWKPAEYANGVKVKQELAFTVGNMKSCVINLLYPSRLWEKDD